MTPPSGFSNLVFFDDFPGSTLDTAKWRATSAPGYGAETFDPAQVSVSGGILSLTAAASLHSGEVRGIPSFQYGYFEARLRLPSTPGFWPAFWALTPLTIPPTSSRQEIDIAECDSSVVDRIGENLHWGVAGATPASNGSYTDAGIDYTAAYHTYGVLYLPDRIDFYVDDVLRRHYAQPSPAVFFDRMFPILSLSIFGANQSAFHTLPGIGTVYPQSLLVDWVKVWQPPTTPATTPAATPAGYIHMHPSGKGLVYDNGAAFVPNGPNNYQICRRYYADDVGTGREYIRDLGAAGVEACATVPSPVGMTYDEYFAECASKGINQVRVWLDGGEGSAHSGGGHVGLEPIPLGRYYVADVCLSGDVAQFSDPTNAAYTSQIDGLDLMTNHPLARYPNFTDGNCGVVYGPKLRKSLITRMFTAADANGVKIQLVLFSKIEFTRPSFAGSQWAVANGGPCTTDQDFFTDATALMYQKRRVDFFMQVWGDSASICLWDVFNEIEYAGDQTDPTAQAQRIAWAKTMAAYVKSKDTHHRPVSTSGFPNLTHPDYSAMDARFSDPSHDMVFLHSYNNATLPGQKARIRSGETTYNKMVHVGEFWPWGPDFTGATATSGLGVENYVNANPPHEVAPYRPSLLQAWTTLCGTGYGAPTRWTARGLDGISGRDIYTLAPIYTPTSRFINTVNWNNWNPTTSQAWDGHISSPGADFWISRGDGNQVLALIHGTSSTPTITVSSLVDGLYTVTLFDFITGHVADVGSATAAGGVLSVSFNLADAHLDTLSDGYARLNYGVVLLELSGLASSPPPPLPPPPPPPPPIPPPPPPPAPPPSSPPLPPPPSTGYQAMCAVRRSTLGLYGGVYISTDFSPSGPSPTWTLHADGLPAADIEVFRVDPFVPFQRQWVYLSDQSIYRRDTAVDDTWHPVLDFAAAQALVGLSTAFSTLCWIAPDPTVPGRVYSLWSEFDFAGLPGGEHPRVLRSDDYGDTWTAAIYTGAAYRGVGAIEASGSHLWVAANNIGSGSDVTAYSSDGGSSWTNSAEIGISGGYGTVLIDPGDPSKAWSTGFQSLAGLKDLYAMNGATASVVQNLLNLGQAMQDKSTTGGGTNPDNLWIDPADHLHQRIQAGGAIYVTYDAWATVLDSAPATLTGILIPGEAATLTAFNDDPTAVIFGHAGTNEHVFSLASETDTAAVHRDGDNYLTGPYTDAIPSPAGAVAIYGLWVYRQSKRHAFMHGVEMGYVGTERGTPLPGDRAAWRVDDFPEEHADDLFNHAPHHHTPTPGAVGDVVTSDGTQWISVPPAASSLPVLPTPTQVGQILICLDGVTFVARMPVIDPAAGWLIDAATGLLLVS